MKQTLNKTEDLTLMDHVQATCEHLRNMARIHGESNHFQQMVKRFIDFRNEVNTYRKGSQ